MQSLVHCHHFPLQLRQWLSPGSGRNALPLWNKYYLTSRADTCSSGPVNASEIGQFFFDLSTLSRKVFSSMLGTSASVSSSISVIRGPSPKWTFALVRTCTGGKPAFVRTEARYIEKQPACAAPTSSSGLVPVPSSKREANVYAPSKAPLPTFIVPLPSLSVPFHTADALRIAISSSV